MTIQLEEGYQTDLSKVLLPIWQQVKELNWLITELQCLRSADESPLISSWEAEPLYSVVTGKMLHKVFADRGIQVVWGIFCGVSGTVPSLTEIDIPFADGNRKLWTKPESFLLAEAEIEIICFDSSLTLVKFRDNELGSRFLKIFPDGHVLHNTLSC